MKSVDAVIVGAGHNGLAMSAELARHGVDHVLLERGEVAQRWRAERWDSMRLLTPNWMARLPGRPYRGDDPHGFMSSAETASLIGGYATQIGAPVHTHTRVIAARADGAGYRVDTERGAWRSRLLVIASGAFGRPGVPRLAAQLPPELLQLHAAQYRHPAQLPDGRTGGVLVVGASATGLQLAQEIHRSGRPVTLAVGEHLRLPRLYRGRDIHWWMHEAGLLTQRIEDEDDPVRARRLPSPQLIGTPERATLDLRTLRAEGVEIVGRLAGVRDGRLQFSGSLRNACALADLKMNRLLDGLDDFAARHGPGAALGPAERFASTQPDTAPALMRPCSAFHTVLWATGFEPELGWLQLPVFDADGRLRHDRGHVAPGACVLGLPFMRRRQSSFIHGCEVDVRELAAGLLAHLRGTQPLSEAIPASG